MDIIEGLHNWNLKRKKDKERFNRKFDSLSLTDRNAYEEITEREISKSCETTYTLMYGIIQAVFYLFIAAIVLYLFFEIDLFSSFKGVAITLIKLGVPLVIFGFILDWIGWNKVEKLKKSLLKV